ncbi:unnamed protein product [Rotaria sordida]|uniref:NAD(P)(+)--arginine ADP-ribosyltransferase n=1 Tax=Rotaria sordida TaxID=392033 RepID=A0A815LT84_9BILA|nr:unnamed protein product [Rotaria sordida]
MTKDESAAITLYSMGWEPLDQCLHVALNVALRSSDRRHLKPWLLFLKLLLTALSRLPSVLHRTVFRGVKLDLHEHYKQGKEIIWWGFSSCTTSIQDLEVEQALGKTGSRTIFSIECSSGKDIQEHSFYSGVDEILLLPGTLFQVVACLNHAPDLHLIHLKEIEPQFPLLSPITSAISQKSTMVRKRGGTEICYSKPTQTETIAGARPFEVIEMDINFPKDESDTKSAN